MASKKPTPVNVNSSNRETNLDDSNDDIFEEGGSYVGDIYIPPPYKPVCSMETNGPRTIITKIINENFKSYYGVRIVGPLHQNFTAVIGPNGSGKSNVIDAMLFVFGYRASNMRTKKVSSLIHNSSRAQNVNSCSVAVVFQSIVDNDDGTYKCVGNEIEVRRTAFKDNSSYYSVNGKKKTYKEIASLLGGYGIDLSSNRFLILQGEVEQISLMKPKAQTEHDRGMLEYLEDIIGTTRYKEPISKLNEKWEDLTEDHQHRLNRIKLLQRELKDMEGPKNAAIEHLRKRNELIIVRSELLQYQRMKCQVEKSKITEVKNEKDEKLNIILKSIEEIEKEKNKNETGGADLLKTLNDLKKHFSKQNAKYEKANSRNNIITIEMQQANNQRKKLKTEFEKEKVKLLELEQIPEKNNKLIQQCAEDLANLEKRKMKLVDEQQSSMTKFKKESEVIVEQRSKASEKLMPFKEASSKILSELNMEKSKLTLIQSNENKQKAMLEDMERQLEEVKSQLGPKSMELNNFTTMKPEIEKKLKEAQDELVPIKESTANVIAKIHQITKQLTQSREVYQESSSRNRILDYLMRKKQEGQLPGLIGRLGDLGAIDDKYNVAISTACSQLDCILVDNMDTAQTALKFLQDNNIGRTTFIALDKQEHLWNAIKTPFQSPENAPRLYDLVRIADESLAPAFYFALRNTLVGADLEQCMRLAYGTPRHRVVSLKGELFECSGTMTGGGKSVARNRMGSKIKTHTRRSNSNIESQADLQNLEIMRDNLQKELEQKRDREISLEEIIRRNYKALQDFDSTHKKLSMEVNALNEQHVLLSKSLKQQQEKVKNSCSDAKAVKKQEEIIQNLELKHKKSIEDSEELENKVKQLDEELNRLKKDTLFKVEKELKNVTKNIDDLKKESAKLTIELTNNERNLEKCKKMVSKHEADIKNFEKTILDLRDEKTKLEEDAAQLVEVISEYETKISETEEEYNSLKSSTSDLSKQLVKLNSDKLDSEQEVAELASKLKENASALHKVNSELQSLKLEDIPYENENEKQKLKEYTNEELAVFKEENLLYKSSVLHGDLKKSQPNMQAIEEYKNKEVQLIARTEELDALTDERNNIRKLKEKLSKDRHDQFITGFQIISLKLKELYQVITLGGDASLDLVDSMLPFNEGIVFNVRPFKKSWKAISDLSGGEKTLASLSLVLALHYYRPSPLYVMDEIDAALDFRNVSIVANYIKERTRNAQFIIISLRNNMFDLCDRFVCIHKTRDCSKAITIDNTCSIGKAPKVDNAVMDKKKLVTQAS
ncbi:structural maintenance of chromosomes protein 4-like isoform X2 [Ctenocephalides felis]|nr:structural maintenance of chromosomes protein 4-like isoform X2 [Ctenocephalides felis]